MKSKFLIFSLLLSFIGVHAADTASTGATSAVNRAFKSAEAGARSAVTKGAFYTAELVGFLKAHATSATQWTKDSFKNPYVKYGTAALVTAFVAYKYYTYKKAQAEKRAATLVV